ncbi:hypothetical protein TIFTF001_031580 [Ficus carica]|uniref:Uncharacterized protein n=1 Tax=Ficus carica TaxID=3494 RepID=A0AA88J5D3_FICCA|nr:hypothetical protein TIFTF001_031580 [Ficus carica]
MAAAATRYILPLPLNASRNFSQTTSESEADPNRGDTNDDLQASLGDVKEIMFSEVAILKSVETRILSPQTTYEAYFVFKLAELKFGFKDMLIQMLVNYEGRESEEGIGVVLESRTSMDLLPQDRGDRWKEIEMGEFFNEHGEDGPVLCSLKEIVIEKYRTKSALIVEGIELRPKFGR